MAEDSNTDTSHLFGAILEHYMSLHDLSQQILKECLNEVNGAQYSKCHSVIADIEKWLKVLQPRRESAIFSHAAREYQFSLLMAALGHYRHSFSSLRLFIEHMLAGIYYSTHELLLREWLSGARDNNWRRITREKGGLFDPRFVRSFCPELSSNAAHFATITGKLYRECSEYVHGNAAVSSALPPTLRFDQAIFEAWLERAKNSWLIITFFLYVRYQEDLTDEHLVLLEPSLLDQLGYLSAVRDHLSGTKGDP